MNLSGSFQLPAPAERVYHMLLDPAVLARAMPGCERLDSIGENEYAMRMKMVLASVTGLFDGKVRIVEQDPSRSFRLIVQGAGKIGFMKGDGLLTLTPAAGGTSVEYDGTVEVGGTIAAVGQRLLDATARMIIKRFFEKLVSLAPASENAVPLVPLK